MYHVGIISFGSIETYSILLLFYNIMSYCQHHFVVHTKKEYYCRYRVKLIVKTFVSILSCLCCIRNNNDINLRTRNTISNWVLLLLTFLYGTVYACISSCVYFQPFFLALGESIEKIEKQPLQSIPTQTRFPVSESFYEINSNRHYNIRFFFVKHRRLFKIYVLVYDVIYDSGSYRIYQRFPNCAPRRPGAPRCVVTCQLSG